MPAREAGVPDRPDSSNGRGRSSRTSSNGGCPLLSITGIKAREMFGYAIAMMLLLIPFLAIALIVIPY